MSYRSITRGLLPAVTLAAAVAVPGLAQAQNVCANLWYQRNAIYAAKGYCFQTARARAVFGYNCFAPYGALSPYEQRQVAGIQQQERAYGCPP